MPAVKTRIKIGFGSECEVFDVGNGRCYKKYYYGNIDVIYESAKRAFETGIAPEVYGRDANGYYTEIVKTFGHLCNGCEDKYDCYNEICDYAFEFIDRGEYEELHNKICEIFGDDFHDLHIGNIGRNKNGKLVAIDFGMSSGLGN